MTRGAYVVGRDEAERTLAAIEARVPHVLLDIDLLGDGLYRSKVRLITAHVISIIENSNVQECRFPTTLRLLAHADARR